MDSFAPESLSEWPWPRDDQRTEGLRQFLARVKAARLALVSKADRARLVERHLIPSLEGLKWIPQRGKLLDIGSGGGFPALPIAMARPELEITLVESNLRKSFFLRDVSRGTLLSNVSVVSERAESLGSELEKAYELVSARAVAELPQLIAWTRRFLKSGGRWILWKGRDWKKEGDPNELGVRVIAESPLSDGGILLVLEPEREN